MAKSEEVTEGRSFRVKRSFRDEFISENFSFDDGLHEPVGISEGTEGVVHSFSSPDGSHLGYVVGRYPSITGFGAMNDGMRVQTHIDDIEML